MLQLLLACSAALDVFSSGGRDTAGTVYSCFRIPSLVRAADGSLIAFAEGRRGGCGDHGDVRIVSSTSHDDGATWSNISQVLFEAGHTIGNPAAVTDRKTGTIHLLFSRDNQQVFVSRSSDHGGTWTPRENLTAQLKPNPDPAAWIATGPPGGVQLASGRLVAAIYYNPPDQSTRSVAVFSDDGGDSWVKGSDVPFGPGVYIGGEDQVVPFGPADGLAMFMRCRITYSDDVGHNHAIAFSTDGGSTWGNATRLGTVLSSYCQGSIAATPTGGLLISAPSTGNGGRSNLTVWAATPAAPAAFKFVTTLYAGSLLTRRCCRHCSHASSSTSLNAMARATSPSRPSSTRPSWCSSGSL